ncbi:MAG TPA: M48 family metalloprotease [Kofleriaceae bacterium]|nr:M48 family metalloprotease [Kofleriaceae bacterium]
MIRGPAIACALAACTGPQYLGAELPAACAAHDPERCAGWMAERDLDAGELDIYDDPVLRAYVQDIADRLARGSQLHKAPRVVIADHEGTYAAFGDRIVIGRIAIEKLASEAELAGIVAHELVHVEGHHAVVSLFGPDADADWLAARRDAEAVADERAVALLERAGYDPAAMGRALRVELDGDDDEHPPRAERIAHVDALAAGRTAGFDGRAELLGHIDRMIVGRDTRLGVRVRDAWVVAELEIALDLPPRDIIHVDGDSVILRRGRSELTVYPIGGAWAHELAAQLSERATAPSPLGEITVGVASEPAADDDQLGKLERAVLATLPQPVPGAYVVIVDRGRGALVLELSPHSESFDRDRWLEGLHRADDGELAAAEPPRLHVIAAPRAGTVRDLVAACNDPAAALRLDDASRVLAAGDPLKCTDR